jgi:hypothetical protein
MRFDVLVTIGYLPGQSNIFADALSRQFLVPEGYQLFRLLRNLPHYTFGTVFTASKQNSTLK